MPLADFLDRSKFTMELLLCCMLFFWPLKKRSHAPWRMGLGFLACVAAVALQPLSSLQFPVGFLLAGCYVLFCCDISLTDALYCMACAYATQHFMFLTHTVIHYLLGRPQPGAEDLGPCYFLVAVVVGAAFYLLFARRLAGDARYHLDTRRVLFSVVVILAVVLVLSLAASRAAAAGNPDLLLICRLYAMFCCLFFLWVQVSQVNQLRLEREVVLQQYLRSQQKDQYRITKENIDIINRKCHDLKHQLSTLRPGGGADRERYLSELEESIHIYDSTLETGNEVLDTVLTEKSLYCEAHQINLTCVADGRPLAFLDSTDIYTIFGNALDNAIESVIQLADPEKRVIAVSVWARGGLLLFQFENYYEQALTFEDGLPVTTKEDNGYHGFGIKSIRYTAKKYGGQLFISTERNLFLLRVTIPIPSN
ncbi:ATP-binding protein [uncultured Pseudoflavonifractor sp.]|uniref:ATP-binding protein n=1 Tax=uncultured Pseudoflavonifractor sp. TaxID=1221379 RepID=UPI0025F932F5|nr:ATP-binding protein [uncultured Pseudoflavonifractor sp.]